MPAAVCLGHFCSRSQLKTSNGIVAEIQHGPVAGEQTFAEKVPAPVSIQSNADERVIEAVL